MPRREKQIRLLNLQRQVVIQMMLKGLLSLPRNRQMDLRDQPKLIIWMCIHQMVNSSAATELCLNPLFLRARKRMPTSLITCSMQTAAQMELAQWATFWNLPWCQSIATASVEGQIPKCMLSLIIKDLLMLERPTTQTVITGWSLQCAQEWESTYFKVTEEWDPPLETAQLEGSCSSTATTMILLLSYSQKKTTRCSHRLKTSWEQEVVSASTPLNLIMVPMQLSLDSRQGSP